MYLAPHIYYVSLSHESASLGVKLYNKWGNLSRGKENSADYSYSHTINVTRDDGSAELNCWGNEHKGNWSSGEYRFEIWYEGRCLYIHKFTIY